VFLGRGEDGACEGHARAADTSGAGDRRSPARAERDERAARDDRGDDAHRADRERAVEQREPDPAADTGEQTERDGAVPI